jgi:hypothetical protein
MEQVKHCLLGGSLQWWYERTVRWLRMAGCCSVIQIIFSMAQVISFWMVTWDCRQRGQR